MILNFDCKTLIINKIDFNVNKPMNLKAFLDIFRGFEIKKN